MAQVGAEKEGKDRGSKEATKILEKGEGSSGARVEEHPHHIRRHPSVCLGRWQGAEPGDLAGWAPRAGPARPGAAPSLTRRTPGLKGRDHPTKSF